MLCLLTRGLPPNRLGAVHGVGTQRRGTVDE